MPSGSEVKQDAKAMKRMMKLKWCFAICLFALGLVVHSGCEQRQQGDSAAQSNGLLPDRTREPERPVRVEPEVPVAKPIAAGELDWIAADQLPSESWYALYYGGQCVGFSHVRVESSTMGASLLKLVKEDVLEGRIQDRVQRLETRLESIERANGQLSQFTEVHGNSPEQEVNQGVVKGTTLTLSTKIGDQPAVNRSLVWPSGTWGPLGTIALLKLRKPGIETISARMYVPQSGAINRVEFQFETPEPASLLGGKFEELTPVVGKMMVENQATESRNWIDGKGDIIKTSVSGGMTAFRIDASAAALIDGELRWATLLDTKVAVQGKPEKLKSDAVTFKIDAASTDPFKLFSRTVSQRVQSLSARSAAVTSIRSDSPDRKSITQDSPKQGCNEPLGRDSMLVRNWAKELVANTDGSTPSPSLEQILQRLTLGVHQRLRKEPLGRKFESVTSVTARAAGDCNGHASLLVALLREAGVPARWAMGLRVQPNTESMVATYHCWVEAWVEDRWIALDAYTGELPVGADRIKYGDSELQSSEGKPANPYELMLPVLQSMPDLTIRF